MSFRHFISAANVVLAVVNIALFCLWFSAVRHDTIPVGTEPANYLLNQVSVQITTLGVIVTFGALLLAALGVFGFHSILERAELRAGEIAKSEVASKWDELVRSRLTFTVSGSTVGSVLPKADDATPAKE